MGQEIEPSSPLSPQVFRQMVLSLYRQNKNIVEIADAIPSASIESVIEALTWYRDALSQLEIDPVLAVDRVSYVISKLIPGIEAGNIASIRAYTALESLRVQIQGLSKLSPAQQSTHIVINGVDVEHLR